MVNSRSGLFKFILWSLGIHLLVVVVAIGLEYGSRSPVEVNFSLGSRDRVSEIQMKKDRPAPAPQKTKLSPDPAPEIKDQSIPDKIESAAVDENKASDGFGTTAAAESAKSRYFSLIAQTIYKNKRYPRQAYSLNQEGKVVVRLRLDKDGEILDLEVLEKGPFKSLTNATVDTIKKIKRFPQIPKELGVGEITFRIPIEYKIQM
jgi:protein TonB